MFDGVGSVDATGIGVAVGTETGDDTGAGVFDGISPVEGSSASSAVHAISMAVIGIKLIPLIKSLSLNLGMLNFHCIWEPGKIILKLYGTNTH